MYGSFASNVDMRSGAPALGTPEYTKAAQASGQVARRHGLPFRSSNTTVSNCLDTIAEVGPGGHHFGTSHTLARNESAFYSPIMSNRQNFEAWQEAGSIDSAKQANAIWKQLLQEYTQPELDPAIDEALVDYVNRRKADENYETTT